MEKRNFVYVFKNAHGAISIVNYDVNNLELNSFLEKLDIWRSKGERKRSMGGQYEELWFEVTMELWDAFHTVAFMAIFERMGVHLVFEYPFKLFEYSYGGEIL